MFSFGLKVLGDKTKDFFNNKRKQDEDHEDDEKPQVDPDYFVKLAKNSEVCGKVEMFEAKVEVAVCGAVVTVIRLDGSEVNLVPENEDDHDDFCYMEGDCVSVTGWYNDDSSFTVRNIKPMEMKTQYKVLVTCTSETDERIISFNHDEMYYQYTDKDDPHKFSVGQELNVKKIKCHREILSTLYEWRVVVIETDGIAEILKNVTISIAQTRFFQNYYTTKMSQLKIFNGSKDSIMLMKKSIKCVSDQVVIENKMVKFKREGFNNNKRIIKPNTALIVDIIIQPRNVGTFGVSFEFQFQNLLGVGDGKEFSTEFVFLGVGVCEIIRPMREKNIAPRFVDLRWNYSSMELELNLRKLVKMAPKFKEMDGSGPSYVEVIEKAATLEKLKKEFPSLVYKGVIEVEFIN